MRLSITPSAIRPASASIRGPSAPSQIGRSARGLRTVQRHLPRSEHPAFVAGAPVEYRTDDSHVLLDHPAAAQRGKPEPGVHHRVADAQPEDEPAAGRLVQLRCGLGRQHRRPQGRVRHRRPDPHPPGRGGHRVAQGQRVAVPLGHEHRAEPGLLGRPGQLADRACGSPLCEAMRAPAALTIAPRLPGELRPQLPLEHLAGRRSRQRVMNSALFGHLKCASRSRHQAMISSAEASGPGRDDHRVHRLAPSRVSPPDHRHVGDGRVPGQHRLDLGRIEVHRH